LNTLEILSSCLDLDEAKGWCPLCLDFEIKTDQQYYSHVGAHLEQLALFVLPQSAEMDADNEEDEDGEDNGQLLADDSSVSDGESECHIQHGDGNPNGWQDLEDGEKAKLKEVEGTAAKSKREAEEAGKNAAPLDKKAPIIRFKDAIGRTYHFPWERVHRWRVSLYHLHLQSSSAHTFQGMEYLINQAFENIDGLAEHVMHGRYDLIGPDKEIILPDYWESTVEPDMYITMVLWPIPEPMETESLEVVTVPPKFDSDAILSLDDILYPPGGLKKKGELHLLHFHVLAAN